MRVDGDRLAFVKGQCDTAGRWRALSLQTPFVEGFRDYEVLWVLKSTGLELSAPQIGIAAGRPRLKAMKAAARHRLDFLLSRGIAEYCRVSHRSLGSQAAKWPRSGAADCSATGSPCERWRCTRVRPRAAQPAER